MQTIEVKFSKEDKNKLVNQLVGNAEIEDKCHEKTGHEFVIKFNDNLSVFAKVLLDDDFHGSKPSRHASTDVQVIETNGFNKVKTNLNYEFEDSINKALIANFQTQYNELSYHI